jgi:hypothetical protein
MKSVVLVFKLYVTLVPDTYETQTPDTDTLTGNNLRK